MSRCWINCWRPKCWQIIWRALTSAVGTLALAINAFGQSLPTNIDRYQQALILLSEQRADEASAELSRLVEQQPQHAGAWLDLAILRCEAGNAAEAERLFALIEARFAPPPGIRDVISGYRGGGCKGPQAFDQFILQIGRGSDSNVNQGASNPNFSIGSGAGRLDLMLLPEYLPQRDQYTLLAADYARTLNSAGTLGFAQLRARKNDQLTRFDTASLQFGAEHPWRWSDWNLRGSGSLGWLTLGDRLYQRLSQIQLRVTPPLALPRALNFSGALGVSHVGYATLGNFDATTFEASMLFSRQTASAQTQASAGLLVDRGAALRPGGNRQGWFANLQNRVRLDARLDAEFGWSFQRWRSSTPYSPGLIDATRLQNTQLLRAALIVPIASDQSVQLEWRRIRNHENISLFQYNSNLLQLSWQWKN